MKKSVLYGFAASVSLLSIGAFADPVPDADSSALTTKGYVDAGLKYVYDAAKGDVNTVQSSITSLQSDVSGLQSDVSGLQSSVGNTAMTTTANTITEAINELNSAITELAGNTATYNDGAGIKVTPGANPGDSSTIGLDLPNNPSEGSYVYKIDANGDGTWAPIAVENSWNPTFLTTP